MMMTMTMAMMSTAAATIKTQAWGLRASGHAFLPPTSPPPIACCSPFANLQFPVLWGNSNESEACHYFKAGIKTSGSAGIGKQKVD